MTLNLLIDEYRSSWALRFLREARSDIAMAEKSVDPVTRTHRTCTAMKKLQTVIYYAFGDPAYLAPLVAQSIKQKIRAQDPILRFLLQVEWLIQINKVVGLDNHDKALLKASHLLHYVTQIVQEITGA